VVRAHWIERIMATGHSQNKKDRLALLDFANRKFINMKPEQSFSTLVCPDGLVPLNDGYPVSSENHI
jgi:hypothetical protein